MPGKHTSDCLGVGYLAIDAICSNRDIILLWEKRERVLGGIIYGPR